MRILMGSADKNKDGVLTREEVGAVAPRAHERVSTRANARSRRPKQIDSETWDITNADAGTRTFSR